MHLYLLIILSLLSVAVTFLLNKKAVDRPYKSNRYIPYLQTKIGSVTKPKLKKQRAYILRQEALRRNGSIPQGLQSMSGMNFSRLKLYAKRSSLRYINSYKESPHEKGKKFETFVARRFDPNYFKFKEARSDLYIDGNYPESNMYPDFLFECKWGNREKLAIECKFREKWQTYKSRDKYVEWSSEGQIERYKRYGENQNARVFVVIGIGGLPESPKDIFIVPLNDLDKGDIYLYQNSLMDFQSRNPDCNFFYNMNRKFLTQKSIA